MKLDILAFGAHPDDIELACTGTLLKQISLGSKVGIVDLTQGELGTRGSAELRLKEAAASAKIQGISVRDNLGMADGFFVNDREHQLEVVKKIRQYQPKIVLANAVHDRHIDHGKAAKLVADACFLSGLRKIETELDGEKQEAWRPNAIYHYIQDYYIEPDFVVDVTEFWDKKMEALMAFSSQFYNPNSKEPVSPIATEEFLKFLEGRAFQFGRMVNNAYGEGFTTQRPVGVKDITALE